MTWIYGFVVIAFQKYLLPLKSAENSVHIEPAVVDEIFYQVNLLYKINVIARIGLIDD